MKLQTKIFTILTFFIFSIVNISAQSSLTIQVFEPLPEIDFATFATSNDLSGTPRIFSVQINPNDKPSWTYLERCQFYIENEPDKKWDGVFELKSK